MTRIGPNQFAIITNQPSIEHCNGNNFRRLYDGINLKAFKTSAGFLSLKVLLTIAACDEDALAPSAEGLMALAQGQVDKALETASVVAVRWGGANIPA